MLNPRTTVTTGSFDIAESTSAGVVTEEVSTGVTV